MKKLMVMLMTTVIAIMSFASVTSAATKADIVTALNNSHILNVYVAQAESYLNSVTVTSDQADQVIALINHVNATVGTKTKLSELTSVQKQSILTDFTAAGVVMGLTVVYNSGNIVVKNSSNQQVFTVSTTTGNIIKQTGFDYSVVLYGLAILMLAGVSGLVIRKRLTAN